MSKLKFLVELFYQENIINQCCFNDFFFFAIIFLKYLFRDTRSSVLEQSLRKLGVERLSKDDVQKMQWETLEAKIGNWIHYMRISVRI